MREIDELDQALENTFHSTEPRDIALRHALLDFRLVRGQIIEVNHVLADRLDGQADRENVRLDPPALVRVHSNTPLDQINRTCLEFLDPEWSAELVEPHSSLDPKVFYVEYLTVFGTSYNTKNGHSHKNDSGWKLIDPQPNSPRTLEVERQQTAQNKEDNKPKEDVETVDENEVTEDSSASMKESREDYRIHAEGIAKIIAAGLKTNRGEIGIRKAVDLYMKITQANL